MFYNRFASMLKKYHQKAINRFDKRPVKQQEILDFAGYSGHKITDRFGSITEWQTFIFLCHTYTEQVTNILYLNSVVEYLCTVLLSLLEYQFLTTHTLDSSVLVYSKI